MEIKISISPAQLQLLQLGLRLEIDTKGRVRFSRYETALASYKRLIAEPAGLKVGRGTKGREEALAIVKELLLQVA